MQSPSVPRPWKAFAIASFAILVAFGTLVSLAPAASAATIYKAGPTAPGEVWFAGNTYILYGHVTVPVGRGLTIQPGVIVKVDPLRVLYVEGRLTADGNPGNPITFAANNTLSLFPWIGIQFNLTGGGSVSWSVIDRPWAGVIAFDTSPSLHNNTVRNADTGFHLAGSDSVLADNTVNGARVGVHLERSDAQVLRNTINGTREVGIDVSITGTPAIVGNAVTNITNPFARGIYVTAAVGGAMVPDISYNTVRGIRGRDGANGNFLAIDGEDGGVGAGILVSGGDTATIVGNTVDEIYGGRGGNGFQNASGNGGAGGIGGPSVGIATFYTPAVTIDSNQVTNVYGGIGGNGGGGGGTAVGGDGGEGGDAYGVQAIEASWSLRAYWNTVDTIGGATGGSGGDGVSDGNGMAGGEAIGFLMINPTRGDLTSNWFGTVSGGAGGNSLPAAIGTGRGGPGGSAVGLASMGVVDSLSVHGASIWTISGGDGGRGRAGGGAGGNASGAMIAGAPDGYYNRTTMSFASFFFITGGAGGAGNPSGGDGGTASGVTTGFVTAVSAMNWVGWVTGGRGGDAASGTGGRGGDAGAFGVLQVLTATSTNDTIETVVSGDPGLGGSPPGSFGVAYFVQGEASAIAKLTVDNATIGNASSFDFYLENYSEVTTISTPFAAGNVLVQSAANLTVRNFLGVEVLWPNGISLVAGAVILVEDDGATAWNVVSAAGAESWLLVTDRVYEGASTATEHWTNVTVSYLAYAFGSNPRSVGMASDTSESFVMIDSDVPASNASALPTYTTVRTFNVSYFASDGSGSGLATVTLWHRLAGNASWDPGATIPTGNFGTIPFTAPYDGRWEFATAAADVAGNGETPPAANDTWTIVDTVRPASAVSALATWQNASSFGVSWSPASGDVARFTILYNRGSGWVVWRSNVTATSGTFTGAAQGPYAFASIAYDYAGNAEVKAGNDTWTLVDLARPFSRVAALTVYQTSLVFTVSWGPQFDTFDIASYRVEVSADGAAWNVWYAAATNTTSSFTGLDGHKYAFRSIATDFAGNVETPPAGNDTWTIIDVTPPGSAVAPLAQYQAGLTFGISWALSGGTQDIVAYTVQVSDNDGPFTTVSGLSDTTATSATFVGQDGHRYAFRSLARDVAGNIEAAPSGNDTWTIVDVTRPSVTSRAPQGAGATTAPSIVIVFSEPMDRTSVEQAFSLSPAMDGTFSWSVDSRTVTFTPSRPLQGGTDYFVVVDTGARDLAGNALVQSATFQFATVAGFSFGDLWWILLVVAAGGGAALLLIMRKRGAETATSGSPKATAPSKAEDDAVIDDVFLLHHRDGILIKHETRRLKPDIDTDILSGMLTAVQQFVKDSFRTEEGELDEMTFGQMHILIGRGKWLILAAMVTGGSTAAFSEQIQRAIKDMEEHHWDQLEDWDGDMALAKVLAPYVKKLIRGDYV